MNLSIKLVCTVNDKSDPLRCIKNELSDFYDKRLENLTLNHTEIVDQVSFQFDRKGDECSASLTLTNGSSSYPEFLDFDFCPRDIREQRYSINSGSLVPDNGEIFCNRNEGDKDQVSCKALVWPLLGAVGPSTYADIYAANEGVKAAIMKYLDDSNLNPDDFHISRPEEESPSMNIMGPRFVIIKASKK